VATCGSGPGVYGVKILKIPILGILTIRLMAGRMQKERMFTGWCGAARFITTITTSVAPSDSGTTRSTGTTVRVSGGGGPHLLTSALCCSVLWPSESLLPIGVAINQDTRVKRQGGKTEAKRFHPVRGSPQNLGDFGD
jgi:hypothetical protein